MADTLNKPKLQLRSSFNTNGNDKTPSPATKLLISHGKPNFTIQKTPKENGTASNPLSPQINNLNNNNNNDSFVNKNNENNIVNNNNNNYNPYKTASVVKSTKFNGVFNAASVNIANNKAQSESNEATKVVLRKVAKPAEPELREGEDENVPEFIRRQRRIQERLAKENVLDFENRRSGYFTHVMITPTSPNRTSFSETMASPAVVPSLEMPAPQTQESVQEETEEEVTTEQHAEPEINNQTNGHVNTPEEEEEVAKAIEEVNKAVAGEDDASGTEQAEEQEQPEEPQVQPEEPEEVVTAVGEVEAIEVPAVAAPVAQARALNETDEVEQTNGDGAAETVTHEHIEANVEIKAEAIVEEVVTKAEQVVASMEHSETNGHAGEHAEQNGHASSETENVTISHTNGVQDGPHIPAPDPSGALGVNYEPKTVVSFSKDLGADANKYPDTVVVQKEVESGASIDPALQEIAKLKFDIKADDADDVQVTPVLRTE